jgi:hypothetical protein
MPPPMDCPALDCQRMLPVSDVIALFEMAVEGDRVLVVEERHNRLVPSDEIDANTKRQYAEPS